MTLHTLAAVSSILVAVTTGCGAKSGKSAPPPSSVAPTTGDQQTAIAGTTLAPFVVTATAADGRPAPGATVAFAVLMGGGSLSRTSATTDGNGQASTILTLGPI